MDTPHFHSTAQAFIKTVKPLLGDYDITFTDARGVILASSIPDRVGFLHPGGAEAAEKRQPVRIDSGNIARYPGSYEGVCFPFVKDGTLLGVMGVRGAPDEVAQMAGLLAACIDLYLGRNAPDAEAHVRRGMRLELLERLTGSAGVPPATPEASRDKCRELGVAFALPARIVAVAPAPDDAGGFPALAPLELEHMVFAGGWLDDTRDLAAALDGIVIIATHAPDGADIDAFAQRLYDGLRNAGAGAISVGVGSLAEKWEELPLSRREAGALARLGSGVHSIDTHSGRVTCMLGGCLQCDETERHLAEMERALRQGLAGKDFRIVMRTIRAYCDAECHSGKAAEHLGIHRNTMNYRMNKIVSLLGLEHESAFVREFFLRLLALR